MENMNYHCYAWSAYKWPPGTQAYDKLRGRKIKHFLKKEQKELSAVKTLSRANCQQLSLNSEPCRITHERRHYIYWAERSVEITLCPWTNGSHVVHTACSVILQAFAAREQPQSVERCRRAYRARDPFSYVQWESYCVCHVNMDEQEVYVQKISRKRLKDRKGLSILNKQFQFF